MSEYSYGKRPVWQWIVIYLIIGGVIYAGVYYFYLKKGSYKQTYTQPQVKTENTTPQLTSEVTPQPEKVITLSKNGFTPSTLTIKVGEKVTWINQSGQNATVNSDPHPIHTVYSPLNLGRLDNGQSVSLVFDKPGKYGYHNHFDASEKGIIIVE